MKKLLILIFFLLFFSGLKTASAQVIVNPNCLTIYGTFRSDPSWGTRGSVYLGCAGNPNTTTGCVGQAKEVFQGQNYQLNNCSCPAGGASGCLYVARKLHITDKASGYKVSIDSSFYRACTLPSTKFQELFTPTLSIRYFKSIAPYCGVNGSSLLLNFKATCTVPNTPTSTPFFTSTPTPVFTATPTLTPILTPTRTPTPTPTPIVTSTSTPTPTTFICPVPNPVLNVRIKCPNCLQVTSTP